MIICDLEELTEEKNVKTKVAGNRETANQVSSCC